MDISVRKGITSWNSKSPPEIRKCIFWFMKKSNFWDFVSPTFVPKIWAVSQCSIDHSHKVLYLYLLCPTRTSSARTFLTILTARNSGTEKYGMSHAAWLLSSIWSQVLAISLMLKSHQFLDQLSSEWYSHAGKIDNVGLLTSKTISFPRSIIGDGRKMITSKFS